MPPQTWSIVVEGATGDTAAVEVKGFLAKMKEVKVESCELKEKTVEAVISSKAKISRADVSIHGICPECAAKHAAKA